MEEVINILHVVGTLNRGGAETLLLNLYKATNRSRIHFDFVVHSDFVGEYEKEFTAMGSQIYRISPFKGTNLFDYCKQWDDFFSRGKKYDIVHGHVRSTSSIYLLIAKKHGLITIAHSHNVSNGKSISSVIKYFFQLPIRYVADYFFACSIEAGKWLFGQKICQGNNFFLLRNGIDVSLFRYSNDVRIQARIDLNITNNFVIGHVGRFELQKNHKFLIDIFYEIYKIKSNAKLLLIGTGPLLPQMQKYVTEKSLEDSVIFLGSRSDVANLMQAMDVFIFPSLYEGLGIALIEAQSAGLPCIVTDTLPREVFTTSLITPVSLQSSPSMWARQALKKYNSVIRGDMYREICQSGYNIQETAQWLEDFYIKIGNKK